MNDTVRMVGGTLGVAVLGSLLSSGYGADMEKATAALPEGASRAAEESLGGASQVAAQMGGGAGETLSRTAETAFSSAMSVSLRARRWRSPARWWRCSCFPASGASARRSPSAPEPAQRRSLTPEPVAA